MGRSVRCKARPFLKYVSLLCPRAGRILPHRGTAHGLNAQSCQRRPPPFPAHPRGPLVHSHAQSSHRRGSQPTGWQGPLWGPLLCSDSCPCVAGATAQPAWPVAQLAVPAHTPGHGFALNRCRSLLGGIPSRSAASPQLRESIHRSGLRAWGRHCFRPLRAEFGVRLCVCLSGPHGRVFVSCRSSRGLASWGLLAPLTSGGRSAVALHRGWPVPGTRATGNGRGMVTGGRGGHSGRWTSRSDGQRSLARPLRRKRPDFLASAALRGPQEDHRRTGRLSRGPTGAPPCPP